MSLTVSMILPTHDRPRYLSRAVEAILRQSRLPDELIVVNDGASDIPAELSDKLAAAGVRFVHERRDTPSLPASRNRGLAIAAGDVIVFTEDDVILPEGYLAELIELYESDPLFRVDAIGAVVVEPGDDSLARRVLGALSRAIPIFNWAPRVCAARYIRLPAALQPRLRPTRWISGGALSMRSSLAKVERFDETFSGYAQGEDTEFAFRVTRTRAMFVAPELKVLHDRAPAGRPDMRERGRMYAANMLHIARGSVEPGAGTKLLLAWHLAGLLALYSTWTLTGQGGDYLRWAAGVVGELLSQLKNAARRAILGPAEAAKASPGDAVIRLNARAHDRICNRYEQVHGEIFNPVEQERLADRLETAASWIETNSDTRVALDLGCGTGNLTNHLLKLGLEVVSADVSAKSLATVRRRFSRAGRCTTLLINGADLREIEDGRFDLVCVYSVLHHVPDYLRLVAETVRVTRPGGVIYIDHEDSESRWSGPREYDEYLRLAGPPQTRQWTRFLQPATYAVKLRRMLNPRYEPEGDVHVWPDDHVEWDGIADLLARHGVEVLHQEDYLLYRRGCPMSVYEEYRDKCADTHLLIARKPSGSTGL